MNQHLQKVFGTFSQFIQTSTTVFVLMIAVTLIIFGHSIVQITASSGATDFHSYWYHGHFILMGEDPYQAFFDGVIIEGGPIAQPGLANTPANTAPLVLILSLFSWLSWTPAKIVWMLINLLLTFLIPALTIRLLPPQVTVTRFQKLAIFFCFLSYKEQESPIG